MFCESCGTGPTCAVCGRDDRERVSIVVEERIDGRYRSRCRFADGSEKLVPRSHFTAGDAEQAARLHLVSLGYVPAN